MKAEIAMCVENIKRLISQGALEAALKLIIEKNDRYNENVEFIKVKALLCLCAEEFKTAISLLKQAEEMLPADAEIYYYLSKCYEAERALTTKSDGFSITVVNTDDKNIRKYDGKVDLYDIRNNAVQMFHGEKDPLVSIYFLAYNNLEKYTKPALEALLKYTIDIDFELILVDNGSNDGTFEYFKSIKYGKKRIYRITKNLGAGYAYVAASENHIGDFYKGKYVIVIPNDVFVTENWLKNMLACIESDKRIGMVVPVSDYVSNFQQVDLGYNDLTDMQNKAREHNISNPLLWEERMRVIPTLFMFRKDIMRLYDGDDAFIYNYGDDDLSFQYRRAGYKLIVCGDVFVHHAGSVVVGKNELEFKEDLEKGAEIFRRKYYGIDAWDDVLNFEHSMINNILEGIEHTRKPLVLGVDVRCGTPLLEIKNKLRKKNIMDVQLAAYIQDPKYWLDLKSICESCVLCGGVELANDKIENNIYSYILMGQFIDEYEDFSNVVNIFMKKLKKGGRLAFKMRNFPESFIAEGNILKNIQKDDLLSRGNEKNLDVFLKNSIYKIVKVVREISAPNKEIALSLAKFIFPNDKEMQKIISERYYFCSQQYLVIMER